MVSTSRYKTPHNQKIMKLNLCLRAVYICVNWYKCKGCYGSRYWESKNCQPQLSVRDMETQNSKLYLFIFPKTPAILSSNNKAVLLIIRLLVQ